MLKLDSRSIPHSTFRTPHSPVSTSTVSRRALLQLSGCGFGALALSFLEQSARASVGGPAASAPQLPSISLRTKDPHFAPRAKAVIMLTADGGASQMDLLDPKPDLTKFDGKQHSFKLETLQPGSEAHTLLASPFKFYRRGQCGMEMSEVIPHLGRVADELCVVRSVHTGHNNHLESIVMLVTGHVFPGRPTMGAWISYALGSENQNLPAYVVLRDPAGYTGGSSLWWSAGWLPSLYRGTEVSSQGAPIQYLRAAQPQPAEAQRKNLDFLAAMNRLHQAKHPLASELETRIQNYELAARMQLEAARLLDVSTESSATRKLYGLDDPVTGKYGLRCLLARKLVEAGVRFVQVFPRPTTPWDSHHNLVSGHRSLPNIGGATDLPTAGLLRDLKQRGLLESTIVFWSGEFGRLPISQNAKGRDHNRNAMSIILAGGGFKSGHVHGATDSIGYKAVENQVSVADLHATILHQLGLDHDGLTFHHAGRDETLTDSSVTGASVVKELLANPAGDNHS